ncbi:MAG: helicase C-terminal domain-containing protein [Candidatus Pacearchaeota archaeon]
MWSLYKNQNFLQPLTFSNGKTQEDVVNEVLDSIEKGNKLIFIEGVCGTGKSAIALNIARAIGKTSVVVPGKTLQNQYQEDYEGDTYLLKESGEKLRINVITGRNNHPCKYLKDENLTSSGDEEKSESNASLVNIFGVNKKTSQNTTSQKESLNADNSKAPCKIDIKEKNWKRIKQYLTENENANERNYHKIEDVKRGPVAAACPYWSPVLPEGYGGKNLDSRNQRTYMGLDNTKFVIHQRKPGCSFYEQFNSYIDSDVIVFNSLKYKLESAINRKPLTEAEIVDECDEFLDSFSNEKTLNLDRLQNALNQVIYEKDSTASMVRDATHCINAIRNSKKIKDLAQTGEIVNIKETPVFDLLKIFLETENFMQEVDEESYVFSAEETAKMFQESLSETYAIFNQEDERNLTVTLVTTNLRNKVNEMVDKNKALVMMSGTIHSEQVLKSVFGLDNFEIIQAETTQQGALDVRKTGMEFNCKHSNLSGGNRRGHYLKALDKCVENSEKPTLVHVNAFYDLPSMKEINDFDLENLQSREELKEQQAEKSEGEIIQGFKEGQKEVLFSTKCARGVDFPGDQCNSIVFTKYPNPNPKEPFWQILSKTQPQNYWTFYKDKARRELLQKVYRGLRSSKDHINVLSPDTRVLEEFEKGI